mmetsp:Transcript_12866/g.35541  ORF Transcript_12866/g.35541 Transcript_12866/m.35541 type:complete len:183 (-) Transcript_12866:340-888(-)|eukprot:CAMPEP_0194494422 /NCGR_PEP_ID=MMETSP0253-20130528/12321_1 /TAXON_ID=2966 /ORGANISM="Noctiluca scintillans" /LENGTH=182 /DNA_ID=CAMNT_0039335527 /DNA_START=62 /DNA_END=610 /DNA_ORIENTATION=-
MTFEAADEKTGPPAMTLTQKLLEERDGDAPPISLQILGRHIASDSQQRQFVEYRVRVTRGEDLWDVHRRYSLFRLLQKRLKAESRDMGLICTWPRFPRRFTRGILDPTSKGFLDKRQAQLQVFLYGVLDIPELERSAAMERFLKQTNDDEAMSRSVLSIRRSQRDSLTGPAVERLEDYLPEK